ncbi:MAG TPA: ABC transporter permease [Spirochaetaceae bacterium]|nr:ABC transporter permease [Spirochaetaceae bacterium]
MKAMLTIARRELRAYVNSPPAYIFIVALLITSGIFFFFVGSFYAANRASMRSYFGLMPVLLSVLLPALTMRLWAEERRQGTYETLITLPFTEGQLVLGKHMAVMAVIALALALSLPVPLMVAALGNLDPGVIVAEYLGIILLSSACAAIGQLVSSMARNQMSAFLATALLLLGLNLMYQLTVWLDMPGYLSSVINWLSLGYRFGSFSRGVLDTRDLAYFLTISAGALYLSAKNLSFAKWS